MAGDRDVLRPSLEPAAALLKDSEIVVIDQAATYVCEVNADRVAAAMKRFLHRGS